MYQDPSGAKKRLLALMLITTLFAFAFSISSFYEWYVLADYDPRATPEDLSNDTMQTLGLLSLVIVMPRMLLFIVTAVFFLIWVYRMHENAHALQLDGNISSPGWAISAYIIPFINFFMPLVSLVQLAKSQAAQLNVQTKNVWLVSWWLLFLFSMLMAATRGFFSEEGATVETLRNDALTTGVSEFTLFLSGCLVWMVISRLTNQQVEIKEE
ncbi:DUF4328 domain-containing protein [Natribacillus halophilus]|uniref:DUF4328 domain-containing protein n=1 Tax=Natribacillus halophilus TaxID=549003 RepID=A0A1G8LL02_9BACI|nr:DUF4328 domain-containing protein [Natribacillus halophilus]SDI56348.1 protein of unknown function [Natribacillus halophilus]